VTKQVKIKLIKSTIGRKPEHIGTVRSLGLSRINDEVTKNATNDILGKIRQVCYLLAVEEV